jgi:uncharacterized protein YdcH (DUF465 family)
MMARIAFDTLAYANKLKEAGLESKIAEAQAEAQAELISGLMDEKLATKDDIHQVIQMIKDVENKLIIKLGSLMIIGVGALATLITILHR